MLVGVVVLCHRTWERLCHIQCHFGTIIQYYTLTSWWWLNGKDDLSRWWWGAYSESSHKVPMEHVSLPFVWFCSHSTCYFPIMSADHFNWFVSFLNCLWKFDVPSQLHDSICYCFLPKYNGYRILVSVFPNVLPPLISAYKLTLIAHCSLIT